MEEFHILFYKITMKQSIKYSMIKKTRKESKYLKRENISGPKKLINKHKTNPLNKNVHATNKPNYTFLSIIFYFIKLKIKI